MEVNNTQSKYIVGDTGVDKNIESDKSNSESPKPTVHSKVPKKRYAFAALGSGGMFELCAYKNYPSEGLTARKGKPFLEIIPANAQCAQDLEKGKMEFIEKFRALIEESNTCLKEYERKLTNTKTIQDAQNKFLEKWKELPAHEKVIETRKNLESEIANEANIILERDKKLAAKKNFENLIFAAKNTHIHIPSELENLDSEKSKLSIVGHGAAGKGHLSTDQNGGEYVKFAEVAKMLYKGGLNTEFGNFTLPTCHSADAETREQFVAPSEVKGTVIKKNIDSFDRFLNVFFSPETASAPAQMFANELKKHKFINIRVLGFQGLGRSMPVEDEFHRVLKNDKGGVGVPFRTVKVPFTPD
jgi:hypothetical protein